MSDGLVGRQGSGKLRFIAAAKVFPDSSQFATVHGPMRGACTTAPSGAPPLHVELSVFCVAIFLPLPLQQFPVITNLPVLLIGLTEGIQLVLKPPWAKFSVCAVRIRELS